MTPRLPERKECVQGLTCVGVGLILGKYIKRHVVQAGKGLRTLSGGYRCDLLSAPLDLLLSIVSHTAYCEVLMRTPLQELGKSLVITG